MRHFLLSSLFIAIAGAVPLSAHAAVEFCNRLDTPLEVAFAYPKNDGQWASKGWYVLGPEDCQIVHSTDDMGEVGGTATYYYYAVSFRGEDQLTWVGTEKDSQARKFCLINDVFDLDRTDATCESRGYIERLFLSMEVPIAPGKKHVVQFKPPPVTAKSVPGIPALSPQGGESTTPPPSRTSPLGTAPSEGKPPMTQFQRPLTTPSSTPPATTGTPSP